MFRLFLFIITCCLTLPLSSQITLTRADYALQPDDTIFSRILVPDSIPLPGEGADQLWDFSDVPFAQQVGNIENAGTHPDFPDANIVEMVEVQFVTTVSQETHFIEQLDDEGHRVVGREVFPATIALAALTGGEFDTIKFTSNVDVYEDPLYLVRFPLNYQDTFSSTFTIRTPFNLTLPIIGLENAPSSQQATISNQYEVSGYGDIILPNPLQGGGEKVFEALMLKRIQTRVDSFLINDEPANPLLLSFLNLQQGQTVTTTNYTFWIKAINRSALSVSFNEDGTGIFASMSRDINNFFTTSLPFATELLSVQLAPNPATDRLIVEFEKTAAETWTLELFNAAGQRVHQQPLTVAVGPVREVLYRDQSLPTGWYQLVLRDETGQGVARKAVVFR